jgi:hypothetical protein
MHRNGTEDARNPRRTAERDASQPLGGQPRSDDEEEGLQLPEQVPSFLTANELQARDPAKGEARKDARGDPHAAASFTDEDDEPPVTDDKTARGDRELPGTQAGARKDSGRKSPGKSQR